MVQTDGTICRACGAKSELDGMNCQACGANEPGTTWLVVGERVSMVVFQGMIKIVKKEIQIQITVNLPPPLTLLILYTEKRSSSPHWNKLRGMWGKR